MDHASSPTTLEEALRALSPGTRLINGGTDVMVPINEGLDHVGRWVNLRKIDSLCHMEQTERGLRIGAGITFAMIERELSTVAPALAQAASTVGSRQIRNVATIGGNVATASPAGDSLLPLLTYDAEVELVSQRGSRIIPLVEFFVGPKKTVRNPDEIITAITLVDCSGSQHFAKVGTRNAMVISICSIGARLNSTGGSARIAVGSVAPTPLLVRTAEEALLDESAAREFAVTVVSAASPISDHRATAEYRRHALGVLAERVHRKLWQAAR
jgi:CO/xanthine dehydrogenase FAD-binding subunit